MALEYLVPLSMDESGDVRTRVLEALGEVIYTFHRDSQVPSLEPNEGSGAGPPEQLIQMFLGRRPADYLKPPASSTGSVGHAIDKSDDAHLEVNKSKALDLFYDDPSRPLICAFNFPAIALVLGPSRWCSDLKPVYLTLVSNTSLQVRRTLAASLGEIARIIGPENADRDLVRVWFDIVSSDEEEVRMKLLEGMMTFLEALGIKGRMSILDGVVKTWEAGGWKGWREREAVATNIRPIFGLIMRMERVKECSEVVTDLLRFSLWDAASAVREAGISVVCVYPLSYQ
jgi:serine/threonine-protein phosphatase 4 regulatory subunit 1